MLIFTRQNITTHIIKIGNDFIKKSQAFDTFIVTLQLNIELGEIRNSRKRDTDVLTVLIIKILEINQSKTIQ